MQMNTKRFVITAIVGLITMFILDRVIFDLLFGGFYAANANPIEGVLRDATKYWALVLAMLAYTLLIMYAIGSRANSLSILEGAKIGAIVGFLLWFTTDFLQYSFFNLSNLTMAIVDPILEAVHACIGGAVIAFVMKKVPGSAPKPE